MSSEECCVCLEELNNAAIMKLECGHAMHTKCGLNWFKGENKDSCPLCRKDVGITKSEKTTVIVPIQQEGQESEGSDSEGQESEGSDSEGQESEGSTSHSYYNQRSHSPVSYYVHVNNCQVYDIRTNRNRGCVSCQASVSYRRREDERYCNYCTPYRKCVKYPS